MRFERATEILKKLDGIDGGQKSSFIWRKAWLAQQDLLRSAWKNSSPLRHVPGLRPSRLCRLWLESFTDIPFDIATRADAVQVGEWGSRLRTFCSADMTSLKIVRGDSHYGPATLHEIMARAGMRKIPEFLVPQVLTHESRDGYICLREELVQGRMFHVAGDRGIFASHVVTPLVKFYETQGVTMLPLSEALGAITSFVRETPAHEKLARLIQFNPRVAVSLCHNDTMPSNLAVNEKGVWFLDWGLATYTICGRDFVRIGEYYMAHAPTRDFLQAQIADLHRSALTLEDVRLIQQAAVDYAKARGNMRIETGVTMAA